MRCWLIVLSVLLLSALEGRIAAVEAPQQPLQFNVVYNCNGERVVVVRCRSEADDAYCSVAYPDRKGPATGGITPELAEKRGDVIKKLQACGALAPISEPGPAGLPSQPNASSVTEAQQYFAAGFKFKEAKKYALAIEALERCIALKPDRELLSVAHKLIGMSYNSLERYADAAPSLRESLRVDPKQHITSKELGFAYYMLGKYPDAVALFQEAIRLNPRYADAYHHLGFAYVRMGRKEEALQAYRTLLTIDQKQAQDLYGEINKPANASTAAATGPSRARTPADNYFAQGEKYYQAKEYAKAIAEYEKVVALRPGKKMMADAYFGIGDSYFFLRQYDKAISNLLESARIDPNIWSAHEALGQAYDKTLQFDKAVAEYREAIRLKPDNPEIALMYTRLGTAYAMMGRKAEAMQVYNTLLKLDQESAKDLLYEIDISIKKGPASILTFHGHSYSLSGADAEALEYYRNALRLRPTNIDVLLEAGNGLERFGQYVEALAVYRQVVAMKPDAEKLAFAHYCIGSTYNEMKEYAKALPEIREAQRLKPDHHYSTKLGISYFGLNQFAEALASFQDALRLKQDFREAKTWVGKTYREMKQHDRAIAVFQEMVRLDPKDAGAFYQLGLTYFQVNRYPAAIGALNTAIELIPDYAQPYSGLGYTYMAMGQKERALQAYKTLLTLDKKLAQELYLEISKSK